MNLYDRLSKYLLALAVGAIILALTHLWAIYILSDARELPSRGGAVSIGLLGSPATGNPLLFGLDSANDFILSLTTRSLLRRDPSASGSVEFVWEIANCDLSNLALVECTLRSDSRWSDGSLIKAEDISATYDAYRQSERNPIVKRLTENLKISASGSQITFIAPQRDLSILEALSLPVLDARLFSSGTTIDPTKNLGGDYVFDRSESDSEMPGVTRVVVRLRDDLSAETASRSPYIERYILKFFPDQSSLDNARSSLTVVLGSDMSPLLAARFNASTLPRDEYIAAFLSAVTLENPSLRVAIRNALRSVPFSPSQQGILYPDPFLSGTISASTGADLVAALTSAGYLSKEERVKEVESREVTVVRTTTPVRSNQYINGPSSQTHFVNEGVNEFVISGTVPAGTLSVSVNGYTLKGFTSGSRYFGYRIAPRLSNIRSGTNVYTVSFLGARSVRIAQESITVYALSDASARTAKQNEIQRGNITTWSVTAEAEQKAQNERNTLIEQAKALTWSLRYGPDLKPLQITVAYHDSPLESQYAMAVITTLSGAGILAKSRPLTDSDLKDVATKQDRSYSLLITGVYVGPLRDLFPFLHSGQSLNGANFASLKNTELDTLLERARSRLSSDTSYRDRMRVLIEDSAAFVPVFAPIDTLLISRSLSGVWEGGNLSDRLADAYVRTRWDVDMSRLSLRGFALWLSEKAASYLD